MNTDSLESLHHKVSLAGELRSVVRTMKAIAASTITQFEAAVLSLRDYQDCVELGLSIILRDRPDEQRSRHTERRAILLVLGSDQGLVGQFNERLLAAIQQQRTALPSKTQLICLGERLFSIIDKAGFTEAYVTGIPAAIAAVPGVVSSLLDRIETGCRSGAYNEVWILSHKSGQEESHMPELSQILPVSLHIADWRKKWPRHSNPQAIAGSSHTATDLRSEFLFIAICHAIAESVMAENTTRLMAMQRAEKNIDELVATFRLEYMHLRQDQIDSELFDVISGYESLKTSQTGERL